MYSGVVIMTEKQKFKAITERLGKLKFKQKELDCFLIAAYLNDLEDHGIVSGNTHGVTPKGRKVVAICEEFDWKINVKNLIEYVKNMVEPSQQNAFFNILTRYCDDREKLFEEFKRSKR